jgi:hypothetical protein
LFSTASFPINFTDLKLGVSPLITTTESAVQTDALALLQEMLQDQLSTYQNESAALSSFERFSGLNRKTLKGFLDKGRQPYPQTIYRFCKWLFKTADDQVIRSSLPAALHHYLAQHGYALDVERKELRSLVCKSPQHLEIYFLTEDHQVVQRSKVRQAWGEQGLEALHELLLHDLVQALDDEHFTRGKVRAIEDMNFYCEAAKLAPHLFPWKQDASNPLARLGRISVGNIVVSSDDRDELRQAFQDFEDRLCQIHARGMKEVQEKRLRYLFSASIFRPTLEREESI